MLLLSSGLFGASESRRGREDACEWLPLNGDVPGTATAVGGMDGVCGVTAVDAIAVIDDAGDAQRLAGPRLLVRWGSGTIFSDAAPSAKLGRTCSA
jgi:hypothetical protein